jgi:hypothetical protein
MITLPIYYTIKRKTKKDKIILVGMNWYRNAHFQESNKVKEYYHKLVSEQVGTQKFNKIFIEYKVYLKRKGTDGQNIRAVIEKFFLDGLVECGAIKDDTIEYVLGDSSTYLLDKSNPSVDIIIKEAP